MQRNKTAFHTTRQRATLSDMDRFVTRTSKVGEPAASHTRKTDGPSQPKSQPKRKCDEGDLGVGFTVAVVMAEVRPMCVLCLKPLAADSMRPNKLRTHLETTQPSHVTKPLDFFKRKIAKYGQLSILLAY